ncbi:MAG: cytochrome C [Geobacter sp.]|nr:cytochrome C [Geobacter sp.]
MKRFFLPALFLLAAPLLLFAKDYKQVTFPTENAGPVIFDHDVHVGKLANDCTVCHNSLYKIGTKNPTATMADMEQGKSCGKCHNKVKAFALAECVRCHVVGKVPIVIPDFGTLLFDHKFHLGLYTCADCHNKLFYAKSGRNPHVTMKQMEEGKSCGACHDGKTGFSVKGECTRCHAVKDIPFAAADPFSHDYHLKKQYGCYDCHSKLFVAGPNAKRYTMREMETGNSCGGCHNAQIAFSVKGDCNRCHKQVGDVRYKAADAFFPHAFHLTIYRCNDCHSGLFTAGPRRTPYTMADMEKKIGRSCGSCHEGDVAFSAYGSCDRCHKGTKELEWKVPGGGTVIFSHTFHMGKKYRCDDCHFKVFGTGTMAKRFTMKQMEEGKSCGACHDGKAAFNVTGSCGRCHPVRDIDFVLDAGFSHSYHYVLYSCTACHNKLFKDGSGNVSRTMVDMEKGLSCGGCHLSGKDAFSVTGSCDRCHRSAPEVVIQTRGAGPTPFSHKVHTPLYKCENCHNKVFTTGVAARRYSMAQMERGQSCGVCHNDKDAFTAKANCTRCHPVKDIPYPASGGLFKHTAHISLYRCDYCHDKIFVPGPGRQPYTMPNMEGGKSCGACHDGKAAFSVKGDCDKCHPFTKAIRYDFPDKKTTSVLFSHKVHKEKGYKCVDCHYKIYGTGVNRRSYSMREMGNGKSCGACHGYNITGKPNCTKCHFVSDTSGDTRWSPE